MCWEDDFFNQTKIKQCPKETLAKFTFIYPSADVSAF